MAPRRRQIGPAGPCGPSSCLCACKARRFATEVSIYRDLSRRSSQLGLLRQTVPRIGHADLRCPVAPSMRLLRPPTSRRSLFAIRGTPYFRAMPTVASHNYGGMCSPLLRLSCHCLKR